MIFIGKCYGYPILGTSNAHQGEKDTQEKWAPHTWSGLHTFGVCGGHSSCVSLLDVHLGYPKWGTHSIFHFYLFSCQKDHNLQVIMGLILDAWLAASDYPFSCDGRGMGRVLWCEPSGRPLLVALGLMACQSVRLVNSVGTINSHEKTDFHNSKELVTNNSY